MTFLKPPIKAFQHVQMNSRRTLNNLHSDASGRWKARSLGSFRPKICTRHWKQDSRTVRGKALHVLPVPGHQHGHSAWKRGLHKRINAKCQIIFWDFLPIVIRTLNFVPNLLHYWRICFDEFQTELLRFVSKYNFRDFKKKNSLKTIRLYMTIEEWGGHNWLEGTLVQIYHPSPSQWISERKERQS